MPEHLAEGSTEPPLSPGKMRLYGMRFCPFDHRVHLVLQAKNIQHDEVFINLKNKPEWYIKKIPSGKVPGLSVDGHSLYESLIIADFLDEKYPQRPLHSKDPLQKAKDRILIEGFGKVTSAYYKMVMSQPPSTQSSEDFLTELLHYDKELSQRGTKYFAGAEPGMVDYMIWPWFERFFATGLVLGDQFKFPQEKFKQLGPWIDAMKEDKTVKEYALSTDIYAKYMKGYISGNPDFNIAV